MVQTFGSHRSHPSLSDGIGSGRPERRTNLPYADTLHATIEVRAIAAVAIVNQESRWRSIPGAAFPDLLRGPVRCRMQRHCNVEDLPVREPDDEEDVKRLEQDQSGHRKVASPQVRCMPRQELSPCPGGDTRAYIWPGSWRKLETLAAPIRLGCAFDPKGDSRRPCVRSELEALPRSPGGSSLPTLTDFGAYWFTTATTC
jgi:hypothetical protein